MKLYIISGEASGDLHGSNLVKELKKQDGSVDVRAWGGDLMEQAGAEVVKHYRDLAFMGFSEVVANIRTIMRNFKECKRDIKSYKPDAVILIDYPGFNLRMAKFAKLSGFPVFYYISPQVWAWKQSRVKKIQRYVDKVYSILPFEKGFYKKSGVDVEFVGHPLIDAIDQYKAKIQEDPAVASFPGDGDKKEILAILPGSRRQEISRMLPRMLKAGSAFPEFKMVVAGAPSQDEVFYRSYLEQYPGTELIFDKTYAMLAKATCALVTSGTATLETALFNVPQVVCYKGGSVSYQIAKRLVNVEYISLVNLIMEKEIVKELIQREMTVKNMKTELRKLLPGTAEREQMQQHYATLEEKLGGGGASALTAQLLLKTLQTRT